MPEVCILKLPDAIGKVPVVPSDDVQGVLDDDTRRIDVYDVPKRVRPHGHTPHAVAAAPKSGDVDPGTVVQCKPQRAITYDRHR